jgi:hypothetical protein
MSSNVVNNAPYLRTTREFPPEVETLARQVNKSYLDIAEAVNFRTIGLYPTNRPAITGERYYITANKPQQTLRQIYRFTATTAINHGIQVIDPSQFTSCFGSYTDGTNSYGLIFGTTVAVAGLITFYITSTQIVFVLGAGAPALTTGTIVLHWLSQP